MENLNNKVKNLNEDSDIIDVIIENEDEIIANSMYDRGFEKGVKQEKMEIARNLLNKNIDIDIISEATGLSKEMVKELR